MVNWVIIIVLQEVYAIEEAIEAVNRSRSSTVFLNCFGYIIYTFKKLQNKLNSKEVPMNHLNKKKQSR